MIQLKFIKNSRFLNELKRKRNIWKLIQAGILTPVQSFEEYAALVKEAKSGCTHRLFTNCYMMPDEIKRLISIKSFYRVKADSVLAFVADEVGYYYMFLYVDEEKELHLPQLDRQTLVENVYYEGRRTAAQERFEDAVKGAGFAFLNTYQAVVDRPQIKPEKYWKSFRALEKSLAAEEKKIAVPSYKQLKAFEKIYRQEIDRFVQKRYTKRERKRQADQKLLHCITDKKGEIYAIQISGILHGGAIASRSDCHNNIYSIALMFYLQQYFYSNMPEDPEGQKEYMRPKGVGGWIAVDNTPSWRIHKQLGFVANGKAMNQFVLPGFAE